MERNTPVIMISDAAIEHRAWAGIILALNGLSEKDVIVMDRNNAIEPVQYNKPMIIKAVKAVEMPKKPIIERGVIPMNYKPNHKRRR